MGTGYSDVKITIPGSTGFGSTGPSEMYYVLKDNILGKEWLGCYWAAPEAPFSTNCPDVNDKYPGYLKLRLNVATFWGTPKETPVKRREFLDSLKYARKSDVVIAGDFNVRIGDVIYLKIDNLSGYPYASGPSILTGYYWVLGIKHIITNSGTHETLLKVSQILPTKYTNAVNADGIITNSGVGLDIPGLGSGTPIDPFTPPDGQIWA